MWSLEMIGHLNNKAVKEYEEKQKQENAPKRTKSLSPCDASILRSAAVHRMGRASGL